MPATVINLATFRMQGETDKEAFDRAMLDPSPQLEIYLPAGQGALNGVYEIFTDYWAVPPAPTVPGIPARGNITRSNVTIYGDGMYSSHVRQPINRQVVFYSHVDPSNPSTTILSNITIRDLLLEGNVVYRDLDPSYKYDENIHIIRVAGVANLRIENCAFRNFSGEGLNLSTPAGPDSVEPKNSNLVVTGCTFTADPDHRGRNAIAILDCATWSVTNSSFVNIGSNRPEVQPGPGAIDIEPEKQDAVITNGTVDGCYFNTINRSAVAFLNGSGADVHDLDFTNCSVLNAGYGLIEVVRTRQVRVNNNAGTNLSLAPGPIASTEHCFDVFIILNNITNAGAFFLKEGSARVSINNNGLYNCAYLEKAVFVQTGAAHFISVLYNNLYDCGKNSGNSPMYFIDSGTAEFLYSNIMGNVIHTVNLPLRIGFIGNVDPSYNTNWAGYDYVNPTGNTPTTIPQGTLIKKP